jgi:hypothetical protein
MAACTAESLERRRSRIFLARERVERLGLEAAHDAGRDAGHVRGGHTGAARRPAVEVAGIAVAALAATLIRGRFE